VFLDVAPPASQLRHGQDLSWLGSEDVMPRSDVEEGFGGDEAACHGIEQLEHHLEG